MGIQNTCRALADPTRREILALLKKRDMSAGELCGCFDLSAAAISRHLSVLREAGLIRDSRRGKYIIYSLNTSVLEEILLWIRDLQEDAPSAEEADAPRSAPDPQPKGETP